MTDADRAPITVGYPPRLVARVEVRATPTLDPTGVIARDLGRYYALLDRERPGALVTPGEVLLIRAALPSYRAARRDGGEVTLAAAVTAHAEQGGVPAAGLDVAGPGGPAPRAAAIPAPGSARPGRVGRRGHAGGRRRGAGAGAAGVRAQRVRRRLLSAAQVLGGRVGLRRRELDGTMDAAREGMRRRFSL